MERSPAGFQNSRYRSTLTVTGRLPGVYQYSVTNRATSGMVNDEIIIESKLYKYARPFMHKTWNSGVGRFFFCMGRGGGVNFVQ